MTFQKLDLFPSSGEERDRTEQASLSPHLKKVTDQVSEKYCSLVI
jgi:hypothetical protein